MPARTRSNTAPSVAEHEVSRVPAVELLLQAKRSESNATSPTHPEAAVAWPIAGCDVELWLAGSVVNVDQPRRSLAMVRKPAGTAVVALGGRIDDFTLLAIEPTRAVLQSADGSACVLSEVAPGPRPTPVVSAARSEPDAEPGDKPPPGKAMFANGELARGVRIRGDGSYVVTRQLVRKALANPGGAAGGAWFRLFEREGRRVGMEVRAVREGTALAALGIRTGDVARSVNGVALDTPTGLIEVLRAVRESDAISISLLRDGQVSDMRYTIE